MAPPATATPEAPARPDPARRGTSWSVQSQPLIIGRCESCRQPDRGLYLAQALDEELRPLDVRAYEVCIDCLPL